MKTAYISHPDTLLHIMDGQHPESPARITAIEQHLKQHTIWQKLKHYQAPLATDSELQRVHHADYVAHIRAIAPGAGLVKLDAYTSMGPMSLAASLYASCAGILATDLVMHKKVHNAFCATRPPGHHAGKNNSAGFCIFNHIAVAAAHAIAVHGIKRVTIIDFDVHHGDGTEDIFKDHPNVMLCSTFQHPFYPHRGEETRSERMLNISLAANSNGLAMREIVDTIFTPALASFKPEFIFVSAGFDAHIHDPIADLALKTEDYQWMTQWIKQIAASYANDRIVSILEGGYDLPSLAAAAAAHITALML